MFIIEEGSVKLFRNWKMFYLLDFDQRDKIYGKYR